VLAAHASTPTGVAARAATLRALGLFDRSLLSVRAAVAASLRGDRRAAVALSKRAETESRQAEAARSLAIALFRRLGLPFRY
jgi:hypothetical protein